MQVIVYDATSKGADAIDDALVALYQQLGGKVHQHKDGGRHSFPNRAAAEQFVGEAAQRGVVFTLEGADEA